MDADFPTAMMPDIERFFTETHPKLTPGLNVYPEVFETGLFFPLQRQRELEKMVQIARRYDPKVIFEIGTDKGGGLYHWCQCFPNVEKVIACEIRGTPYSELFERAFPQIKFLWIKDSQDALTAVAVCAFLDEGDEFSKHDRKIDVMFIDGDKCGFQTDFENYRSLMAQSSVVFMHDVQDSVPAESYRNTIGKGYSGELIIDRRESFESLQLAAKGMPAKNSHDGWLRYWKGHSAGVGVIYIGDKK